MLRYARRLPHWDAIGQAQFVTFRLHGSLPATRSFRREQVATSGEAFVTMDATGPLHLKRPDVAALVVEALLDSDVRFKRCELHAFVVMPNDVHLLATQLIPLTEWLEPLKGFTANQAKKAIGLRDGAFWQNESYDHLVRSDEEFRRIQRYIEWNPVKAGCVQRPEQFRWSSAGAAWKGGQQP